MRPVPPPVRRRLPATLLVAGLACGVLAGCSSGPDGRGTAGVPGTGTDVAAVPTGADAPEGHAPEDVTLARELVAHQAQAVVLVDTVEEFDDPDVQAFATTVRRDRVAELGSLARWLRDRGERVPAEATRPDRVELTGDAVPGLVSDTQIDHLELASGSDADRLFLGLLMSLHQATLELVRGHEPGRDAALDAIAADVTRSRTEQLARIQQLFVRLTS